MSEVRNIHYQPIMIESQMSDEAVFACHFPQHLAWLKEHGIPFCVSGYHWPELLTHYVYATPYSKLVCELTIEIAAEHADAYLDFIGFTSAEPE